jgi:hypothetical protein
MSIADTKITQSKNIYNTLIAVVGLRFSSYVMLKVFQINEVHTSLSVYQGISSMNVEDIFDFA